MANERINRLLLAKEGACGEQQGKLYKSELGLADCIGSGCKFIDTFSMFLCFYSVKIWRAIVRFEQVHIFSLY